MSPSSFLYWWLVEVIILAYETANHQQDEANKFEALHHSSSEKLRIREKKYRNEQGEKKYELPSAHWQIPAPKFRLPEAKGLPLRNR